MGAFLIALILLLIRPYIYALLLGILYIAAVSCRKILLFTKVLILIAICLINLSIFPMPQITRVSPVLERYLSSLDAISIFNERVSTESAVVTGKHRLISFNPAFSTLRKYRHFGEGCGDQSVYGLEYRDLAFSILSAVQFWDGSFIDLVTEELSC